MNNSIAGQGEVLIISSSESFLANSLVSKLEGSGLTAVLSHGNIKEIDRHRSTTELIILFLNEDMEEMTETLVYLKDMAGDLDIKMILIGDEDEHKQAARVIPETLVLEWFKRPLSMDDLIKGVLKYMEDNTGENRRKTVLIVDDDITYMRTIYEWLKDSYHVGMASSGVQAITYLARNKADLILLDYEMPIANGPQVLEMLNSDSETDKIPVMFLTGHGDTQSVLSVVSLCPVDYLLKTIDKPSLLKKLDDFFKKH
ncbi:MAG: response regulator [Lachnospiraceae bacterium]|nr:response regulator [Lachnospiraceae bacterium]MBR5766964.1 response regulator [Lachnospiraceae bacterium]MBR6469777.1 response regulator [Lachnospiraceae bacterium]MBR6485933.1 response regulator [Lachnospiraceae bacterium]